MNNLLKI